MIKADAKIELYMLICLENIFPKAINENIMVARKTEFESPEIKAYCHKKRITRIY